MKARERLKYRVYAAVRGVVLGTELFRVHSELYEPDVFVNVYAQFIDVTTSLNEGQVRLLPVSGRSRELNRFAEELRNGLEKIATELHLELITDPARFVGPQPVMLADVPIGYRAVLLRREPE